MKTKVVRIAFKRGDEVQLDTVYDVQAFCMEFLKPFNKYQRVNWNADLSETFKCVKGFSLEIKIRCN